MTTYKTTKKRSKKSVKILDNPNITRTFENGNMIVTFKSGRTNIISIEQLESRKERIPITIERDINIIQENIDRITNNIAVETDVDKKKRMKKRLSNFNKHKKNIPSKKATTKKIQGWIDAANASK